jgi:hypothetical protein
MSGGIPRAERAKNGSFGQKRGDLEQFLGALDQFALVAMKMVG